MDWSMFQTLLKWILEEFLEGWIRYVIAIIIGVAVAILKARDWRWVTPTLYGFVAAAAVTMMLGSLSNTNQHSRRHPTPETVQAEIRKWLDSFQLSVRKTTDVNSYFALVVRTRGGRDIAITREKGQYDRFITVATKIIILPEDQKRLTKLLANKRNQFFSEVALEFARSKIGYVWALPSELTVFAPPTPIEDLTEVKLIERIDTVEHAVNLFSAKLYLFLTLNI